jgi:glycosyltransferase involved in cell wall biosynthesis
MIRNETGIQACQVLRNTRKPGAVGARNTGFYASKGNFIAFLDDDDEWMPEKIERQVEAFQRGANKVGIVWTQYFNVRGTSKTRWHLQLEGDVYAILCKAQIAGNTSVPLIRRYVLEDVGPFDESFPAAQDTDLWLRITKYYHSTTVYEPLALIHRHHCERITNNNKNQFLGSYVLLRKHWKDLPMQRKYTLSKRICRKALVIVLERLRHILSFAHE